MSDTKQAASGGIGFAGLLTLIFVVAKIWEKIDWGWIWVFAPLWLPAGIVIGGAIIIAVGAGLVYVVASAFEAFGKKRRKAKRNAPRNLNG